MSLSASDLPHRVRVQSVTLASDGSGGHTERWADVAVLAAAVQPGAGREFFAAQQLQPNLSHMVTFRYQTVVVITPKQRIRYATGGRPHTLVIHSVVDVDMAHEQLQCMCSELVPT